VDGLRVRRVAEGFGSAAFFLMDAVLDGLVIEEEGLAEEGIEAGIALAGEAGGGSEGAMGEGEEGAEEAAPGAGVEVGDGDGLEGPLEEIGEVGVLEEGIEGLDGVTNGLVDADVGDVRPGFWEPAGKSGGAVGALGEGGHGLGSFRWVV